ncbi:putative enoyl-CoA hydratase [Nocardia brasiliensis NBRC 14402]|uniref:crotonase/enoyl-CoA hydratase family protein n=1 Tax=Nocardia brasiliensis TaxID=37326 RepID=UPI0002F0E973|nr:crotonase/enoyl-CoA hydratase family protein [Nocardia brasiliensis]ASF09136.1 enoyl-CoA hydratase [Nocardia brasiliensis]GAJ83919.1 putative enoyl-CoA hydratase [Nocardia brasiliensis NBRC 14402]SUB40230.1 Probable enoyl-CoA hydratase echA8 [Nocardia brasiliensis]
MPDFDNHSGTRPAAWYEGLTESPDSPWSDRPLPPAEATYRTLTYEVTGRIARITFNRPEHGNAITSDTPIELAHAVERADLDPRVHVMVVSGRGKGFCGGYDLSIFAENSFGPTEAADSPVGTVLDPVVQARNHNPRDTWDPMVDYAMMSRFNRGFASLLYANKPTVAKLHGFAVAGGTDIALYADQIICADDTKIGYPPTRVWGIPAAGMWAHRLGDQRAKRLLFTGDCLSGKQAEEWGLAVEAAPADELDERTEALLERIARMPVNQLIMAKLALNSALLAQGVANSGMISTVFDGISRHTREGYAFQLRAATEGFREAVRERDEPYGDWKRTQFEK